MRSRGGRLAGPSQRLRAQGLSRGSGPRPQASELPGEGLAGACRCYGLGPLSVLCGHLPQVQGCLSLIPGYTRAPLPSLHLCEAVDGTGWGWSPRVLVGIPPLTGVETEAQSHTARWGQSWGLEARPLSPSSAVFYFWLDIQFSVTPSTVSVSLRLFPLM